MRKLTVLALLLTTSCFTGGETLMVQSLSPKKQKHKIALLEKKLALAKKEQKEIESEVERLSREVDEAKLALIRRQLDEHERRMVAKAPDVFIEEREALYRLIESGPSPTAFEAQVELDRILRIITEQSDF